MLYNFEDQRLLERLFDLNLSKTPKVIAEKKKEKWN
jgi:hypothetical protein